MGLFQCPQAGSFDLKAPAAQKGLIWVTKVNCVQAWRIPPI